MAERRRQELEEKRAKLAEMKRAREQRQAMLKSAESATSQGGAVDVSCRWVTRAE
jgi:dynein intermediate chain